ncbi:uncharacterized protein LOC106091629 [Stomoxys calcitrans]|uniref:Uncharacterized protein n=1 Tax=Stomoxys calcitrans TaxID=35570 RepID=A0A1I8NPU0_STOCA|nr:uncharacterized protein LOC106091629 [Stomoxys calcitrans]
MAEFGAQAIPQLEISPDTTSEGDNAATGSSSSAFDIKDSNGQSKIPKISRSIKGTYQKMKPRKSNIKRLGNKTPSNTCFENKSKIPKPLLLGSSSLTTPLNIPGSSLSPPSSCAAGRTIATKEQEITAVLQRPQTNIILAYRKRKSISQMNFKQFQRLGQSPNKAGTLNAAVHEQSLVVSNNFEDCNYAISSHLSSPMVHAEPRPRFAEMKIFSIIMLNAWRKRRNEVKHLSEELAELKKGAIKTRNQLHVFNTLFRVEQKRNDELSCQLKHSLQDINKTKSSCESLTTSLMSLQADKMLLEQQHQTKDQEIENLTNLLSQTKSDVFKLLAVQRELHANLAKERREVQVLKDEKTDLLSEICQLKFTIEQMAQQQSAELLAKVEKIKSCEQEIENLERQVMGKNCVQQPQAIETMETAKFPNDSLKGTVANRLKKCWNNSMAYSKTRLNIFHWLVYFLLPAAPPPCRKTFPFGPKLGKCFNIA